MKVISWTYTEWLCPVLLLIQWQPFSVTNIFKWSSNSQLPIILCNTYSTWHNRGGILLHPESVTLVSLDWVWILSNNLHQQIMPFHHVFTLRSCMQNNGGITVLFCNWWKGYFSLPAYSVSIHGHGRISFNYRCWAGWRFLFAAERLEWPSVPGVWSWIETVTLSQ